MTSARRPVVLFSTGPLKDADNPYLHQLVAGVTAGPDGVDVRFLTPADALRGRLDVLHVQWPHQLAHGANPLRTAIKTLLTLWLLGRVRRRRVPVVRTWHNVATHEGTGRLERFVTRRLDRLTSIRVYLNESADNDTALGVVALHPDYTDWLRAHAPAPAAQAADVHEGALLFGLLRPYKEIETLVAAAGEAGVPTVLAGRPVDEAYGARLRAAVDGTTAVTLDERHLPDAELAALVRRHRLVVLPYRAMYNSGALLYALSLGTPVLAPSSAANLAIRAEVGADWLHLYDGPLTAQVLAAAYAATASRPTAGPDLSRRDWATHADLHRRIYRTVRAAPAPPRTRDPLADQRANRAALVADPAFGRHSPRSR
ncbi:hypothetical protein KG112_02975 [Nocardioides sp. zg-ZUI104]|uniref:hypothetical protein n=1 Tax=Nocardioides faecalis TaxID=2803858 RepID=UPI001BD07E13|nr:hypothetical protein [Nocardioides faecalis]MBS4751771.1 hypothetical protein [Nocardioides faecalis]